jgi:RNA polymerase sigma-70 factor (ECF subfamily)
LKQEHRHQSVHEELGRTIEQVAEDPEFIYLRAEARQLIYEEIEKLPYQCAEVVRRFVVEGKSVDEIAAELNIAYKTVINQKAKGFNHVRAALLKNKLLSLPILIAAFSILRS